MPDLRKWRPGFAVCLVIGALLFAFGLGVLLISDHLATTLIAALLVSSSWGGMVLLAARFRDRAKLVGLVSKADVRSAQRAVTERVDDARAKESRHEYHQERALARIEEELRRLHVSAGLPDLPTASSAIDVLFVTSNGAGLGHVSRLLAIAEHLPGNRRFELLTLSKAYKQAATPGLTVHYFPSSEATGETPPRWNRVFRDHFRRLVLERRPRVVVFDGTWVYTGLTDVCRGFGIPLVWVQRGMWKAEVDQVSVQRHAAITVADEVIVPGDYAGEERVDVGGGIQPHHVGPVVRTGPAALLLREAACKALGLESAGRYVLLNLGGGVLGDATSLVSEALARIKEITPELQVVQVVSPLQMASPDPRVIRVEAYPVMPYARAFDFMISAAGYNAVQEAVALGVPTVLVPNAATKTDDQVRRATQVAERGYALVAEDEASLDRALRLIADENLRREICRTLDDVDEPRGAQEAAELLDKIITGVSWPQSADTVTGR